MQPWATLIACGRKTVEVRAWRTNYRGPIAIVSSMRRDRQPCARRWYDERHPLGVVVCSVDLVDVVDYVRELKDAAGGVPVARGRYAWVLEGARVEDWMPVRVRGRLGLYDI